MKRIYRRNVPFASISWSILADFIAAMFFALNVLELLKNLRPKIAIKPTTMLDQIGIKGGCKVISSALSVDRSYSTSNKMESTLST